MEYTYLLGNRLSEIQADSLVSKLIYSVEGISGCFLKKETSELVIESMVEIEIVELGLIVEQLIKQMEKIRTIKHRIIKKNFDVPREDSIADRKSEVDSIFFFDGKVRKDLSVKLFKAVEELICDFANKYNAKERKYPSMIPLKTLDKCKYIQTFPQNIYLVSEIPHRLDVLEVAKQVNEVEKIIRLSPFALSPAVCFHCYEELEGQIIEHSVVLSAEGSCFRHEAPWRIGKHRMNEFSMREIVFIGSADFVESLRNSAIEGIWSIFNELGLEGYIETASDPFYFEEDALKGQHQLMMNMKYELVSNIYGGSESFSIASFNNVRDSLCKAFNVRDSKGELKHSGCVAFGIDRWVYTLISVYGINLENWPIKVKIILKLENL